MKQAIKTIITLMKRAVAAAQKLEHMPSAFERAQDNASGTVWVSTCALCKFGLVVDTDPTRADRDISGWQTVAVCPRVPLTATPNDGAALVEELQK